MIRVAVAAACEQVIRRHAGQAYPEECCGLLAGTVDRDGTWSVHEAMPATNEATAADRYQLAPRDYLLADRVARARGWDIIGVYHSHPDSPAEPSALDLQRAWRGMVYLIVPVERGRAGDWRGWLLGSDAAALPRFHEVELVRR